MIGERKKIERGGRGQLSGFGSFLNVNYSHWFDLYNVWIVILKTITQINQKPS